MDLLRCGTPKTAAGVTVIVDLDETAGVITLANGQKWRPAALQMLVPRAAEKSLDEAEAERRDLLSLGAIAALLSGLCGQLSLGSAGNQAAGAAYRGRWRLGMSE